MGFFESLLEDEPDVAVIKKRFQQRMAASLWCLVGAVGIVAISVLALGVREQAFFWQVLGAGFGLSILFKLEAESLKNSYHRVKQATPGSAE